MKNILLTGGTGFIGRNVIELFQQNGDRIIALSTHNDGDISILRSYHIDDVLFEEDLDVKNKYQIDCCIHLASYGVKYGDSNIETMIDVNIKLATKVLFFCVNNNCKVFLSAGSCFEYGTQDNLFLNEQCETKPEDIYASSKVASHTLLKTIALKNGIQFIVCRPFGVYGKYEPPHRLLPLIIKHGSEMQRLEMSGGKQLRDFLYVKDVANAFYQIMVSASNFDSADVVNICSGEACSIKTFAEEIIKQKNFDKSLFVFGALPYRQHESMRFVGDNAKIKKLTSWTQKYSLEEGIKDYCECFPNEKND